MFPPLPSPFPLSANAWFGPDGSLLDPAHIPVSHDKTNGGGKKENACEIDFDVRTGRQRVSALWPVW